MGQGIYVDESARVKVQFHWDRYGKADAGSSCWIRVSQPWAGGGFGGVSIPRIGHEVIVEFIEGDPDRPIITGRVYNGSNLPNASNAGRDGKPGNSKPKDMTQAAMMTSFKSNSLGGSGGSNEITMNDAGGSEGLFIKAQKDEIHNVGNDREDKVGNDEKREVGNNRTREVGVDETVTVGVNRSVTVGADHTESIGANQTITIGANQTKTIGVMSTETVGAAKVLSVGAAYAVTVGGIMNTAVGGASFEEVGMTKKIIVADSFELVVGDASIKMDKSGKIRISGTQVEVSGGDGVKVVGKVVDIN
jgi:type VI secretion system secreted protein VgrG